MVHLSCILSAPPPLNWGVQLQEPCSLRAFIRASVSAVNQAPWAGPNACFSLNYGMLRCSKTAHNLRFAAVASASHGHKQAQLISKFELC